MTWNKTRTAFGVFFVSIACTAQGGILSDDFEDGSIDTTQWSYGGGKNAWNGDPDGGNWTWSFSENGGALNMQVSGPESANTYGAHTWLQSNYDFNDGASHLINFSWSPQPVSPHCNGYFIQVSDGWVPNGDVYHWPSRDGAYPATSQYYQSGTTNLLWNNGESMNGRGWWFENDQGPGGPLNWSVSITPSGSARLFDAPNGGGQLLTEQSLDMETPWYFRFVMTAATSAGYPAGDTRMQVSDVATTSREQWLAIADGGRINGQTVDASHTEIVLSPGEAVTGSVNITSFHDDPSGAVWPVSATITWGDREQQGWTVDADIPYGENDLTVDINAIAPTTPGLYHLVVASSPQFHSGQVLSTTSAGFGPGDPGTWYDGNDVGFDWSEDQFQEARDHGWVTTTFLTTNGYVDGLIQSAAVIDLMVVPEPSTIALLVIGAIGCLARRRRRLVG